MKTDLNKTIFLFFFIFVIPLIISGTINYFLDINQSMAYLSSTIAAIAFIYFLEKK